MTRKLQWQWYKVSTVAFIAALLLQLVMLAATPTTTTMPYNDPIVYNGAGSIHYRALAVLDASQVEHR